MTGNVINSCLSKTGFFLAWYEAGRGAPKSEHRKMLFYQQPDMTDDNAVPCGKSASPPERPPSH